MASQHRRYFYSRDLARNPRQAILEDLGEELDKWVEAGENVLVIMDANTDVRKPEISDFFDKRQMREIIHLKHGRQCPATQNRNASNEPIEGIFATAGLRALKAGYFPFDEGCVSDHRLVWVDIAKSDILGIDQPDMVSPQARRLKTQDTRLVDKYVKLTRHKMQEEDLFERSIRLQEQARLGWNPRLEEEYNDIYKKSHDNMVTRWCMCWSTIFRA